MASPRDEAPSCKQVLSAQAGSWQTLRYLSQFPHCPWKVCFSSFSAWFPCLGMVPPCYLHSRDGKIPRGGSPTPNMGQMDEMLWCVLDILKHWLILLQTLNFFSWCSWFNNWSPQSFCRHGGWTQGWWPPFITLKMMVQKLGECGQGICQHQGMSRKGSVLSITLSLLKWPFHKELLLNPKPRTISLPQRQFLSLWLTEADLENMTFIFSSILMNHKTLAGHEGVKYWIYSILT